MAGPTSAALREESLRWQRVHDRLGAGEERLVAVAAQWVLPDDGADWSKDVDLFLTDQAVLIADGRAVTRVPLPRVTRYGPSPRVPHVQQLHASVSDPYGPPALPGGETVWSLVLSDRLSAAVFAGTLLDQLQRTAPAAGRTAGHPLTPPGERVAVTRHGHGRDHHVREVVGVPVECYRTPQRWVAVPLLAPPDPAAAFREALQAVLERLEDSGLEDRLPDFFVRWPGPGAGGDDERLAAHHAYVRRLVEQARGHLGASTGPLQVRMRALPGGTRVTFVPKQR
ncbi:MAG TPA: hypothetical protein VFV76_13360 [Actinomycetes bacterium]|nr:hypothetical protein [Actinomycetes bacterium]